MLHLSYVTHSEIGLVRKNNQDSAYASSTMLLVADGMGGAAAGDLASAVAVADLKKADIAWDSNTDMLDALEIAVAQANHHIADLVSENPDLEGMGTTVCGGLFDGDRIGIAHIGDSRSYLLRDGEISRLTKDHTWVQSLVDEGRISAEDAPHHPHRSLLLKVLNGQPANTPDLFHVRLQDGDRIMFCSDGLCGLVDDDVIFAGMEITDPDQSLKYLVAAAHEEGGSDNITIVLADVTKNAPSSIPDSLVLGAAENVTIPTLNNATITNPLAATAAAITPLAAAKQLKEESDSAPKKARKKHRWLARFILLLLLAIGSVAALIGGGYYYANSRYYLGDSQDRVTIYRGIPGKIGSWQLSSPLSTTDVVTSDLPKGYATRVIGNDFTSGSAESLQQTVTELKSAAQACLHQRQERSRATVAPSPTPTSAPPTITVTAPPSESATSSPAPDPTATPTPTPTPSPNPIEGC
ncbi:MAG: PP2C family protein-serine/threonine phosphatase [Propionibacteriaceae bacterium]